MKSTLICTFETVMQTAIKEKQYSTVASNEKKFSWNKLVLQQNEKLKQFYLNCSFIVLNIIPKITFFLLSKFW